MTRGGIFGPSLAGKTTLAKYLSREYWQKCKMRTLVLDPTNDDWGQQAMVFTDDAKFWDAVWKTQNCLVIADEASETINRDKELIPVFTRLRHHHHKLIVIGHSGVNLLPIMRQQIDTLYLFRQSRKACLIWCEDFIEDGFADAYTLKQYEFYRAERWKGPPTKMVLPKGAI